MAPLQVMYWIWDAWIVSWMIAAIWSARMVARPPAWRQVWRDGVAFAGALIIFGFAAPQSSGGGFRAGLEPGLLTPLWQTPAPIAWGFVGLTLGGLGFTWWARLHLGRMWSGVTSVKIDHRIVDTGPYGAVRHPIYSGILAGLAAMALLKATPAALAGLVLASAGFWLRAKLEERFLRAELGAEIYDAYSRRVPMLFPRGRRSSDAR